jgi:hypothetical protein
MKRREFHALIGGAAIVSPLTAHALQGKKLPTIGVLGSSTRSAWAPWIVRSSHVEKSSANRLRGKVGTASSSLRENLVQLWIRAPDTRPKYRLL